MKSIAFGSLFALILSLSLFASQVDAKDKDKNENKGRNNYEYKDKHENKGWNKYYKGGSGSKGSVPIPGTLLLFGGGLAGLIIWRTKQPRP